MSSLRPVLCAALLALAAGRTEARVYLTVPQALDAAFPKPAQVERLTLYLDDAQAGRAAEAAGVPVEARVVPYYVGRRDGRVTGYAYFDTHLVRTLPETILVLVAPDGSLSRIDILSFDEPEDYLPSGRWLQQFPGRRLEDLGARQGLRALTGATLSSRAVTQAARRVLALHRLFVGAPRESAPGGAKP
ncbi:MAG TPA: FMN-binding protein [Candidatus Binatia bacterium]|nr:FMN-binding protein [Candidatus Binatia bacterium]